MGFLFDYLNRIAEVNPSAARELLELNKPAIAKEMGIKLNPVGDIKTRPQHLPKPPK